MIKRWRFTIAAVVIAVIATLVYQFWYRRVPAECKPVQELLSFNSAQSKVIDENLDKTLAIMGEVRSRMGADRYDALLDLLNALDHLNENPA